MNLSLVFKPTSFNLLLVALAQNTFILPCHDHASYCALHWLCFFLVCRYLSPLSRQCSDDEIDDTDEELYHLQKCQASKTPLFIPIQSHSLAPALFYCIRTTTTYLLLAAVAEPLSSAWPVIATVNRWNPLAWVGVVWALMCLLIHACLSCLLLLRVESGLIHRGWIRGVWTCPTMGELSVWTRFGKGSGERPCRSTWWVVSLGPSLRTEFCVSCPMTSYYHTLGSGNSTPLYLLINMISVQELQLVSGVCR